MENLTESELSNLRERANNYIGQLYPVTMNAPNPQGRRGLQTINCEFVGFTDQTIAFKEESEDNALPLFRMPIAKFNFPKGIGKKALIPQVSLMAVVQYFEAQ